MTEETTRNNRSKRRAAVCCLIFGAIFLAGIVCRFTLLPHLLKLRAETFQSLPYMLYGFSVPPLTALAAGGLLAAALSLFASIRVPQPLKVVFLVLGTAFCVLPLLFSLETAAMLFNSQLHQPVFSAFGYVLQSREFLALFFRYLPFAAGILLYLGFAG